MQHQVLGERGEHDLVVIGRGEEGDAAGLRPIDDAGEVVGHGVGAIGRAEDGGDGDGERDESGGEVPLAIAPRG